MVPNKENNILQLYCLNGNIPSDIDNNNLNYYECYNCEYKCNNKTMMSRHLSKKYKCKYIRDIEIDLNECKEYILNKVSYEDYLKIVEENNNTDNIILELKDEINKLNIINSELKEKNQELNNKYINEILELKIEFNTNISKLLTEKEKLLSKIYNKK